MKTKIKKAKISTEISCSISCPDCGIEFEINGSVIMFSSQEWSKVPELLTCRICGVQVARPRSPYGHIKRPPRIALEIRKDYSELSKADLIEVALSFAQIIYGESLSATDLMKKIKQEKETINQNNNY